MMTAGPAQKTTKKILLEDEIFTPGSSKSSQAPCRMVWDLVIYDSKNSMTKLEDLSEKGPFTAVAVAKEASGVRPECVGCTVIISPIMEYSMEFPCGKEAIVWLRSNRAFYRVMSVNPSYEYIWAPLKSLLDMSGHVINVMLKSTLEHLTMYMMKKIAGLAGRSLQETVGLISSGRAFIIEQIKNQHNPKLFKYLFFKDLSSAKSWLQFKDLVEAEADSAAPKKTHKPKAEEPKAASKETVSKSKISEKDVAKDTLAKSKIGKNGLPDVKTESKETKGKSGKTSPPDTKPPKASLPDPIPVKAVGKTKTETRPKRILMPAESDEDIFPSSAKARKNSGKSSSAPRKPLVASSSNPQTAKKTDVSKSLFTANLINVDLPSESDFEFKCPYCELVLQKSSKLSLLLPRVRIHLQLHPLNADLDDRFRGLTFSERFTKFTQKLSQFKQEDEEEVGQSVLEWPKRVLPTLKKMDIDDPVLPIEVVEAPVSSSSASASKTIAESVAPEATASVAVPVPTKQAVSLETPASNPSGTATVSMKIPRPPPAEPRTGGVRASPLKQPSLGRRTSPLKRTHVGSRDHLSNAYARTMAPVQAKQKDVQPIPPSKAPPTRPQVDAPSSVAKPTAPFSASCAGNFKPKQVSQQKLPSVPTAPSAKTKIAEATGMHVHAHKPSDFPSNPPTPVQRNLTFGTIDLITDVGLPKSPVRSVNLCGPYDSAGLQSQEVGSRLNRLPDVRTDKCWKCGFRVTSRICSQCESCQ